MDVHKNAALTPRGREQLARRVLEEGWTKSEAAEAFGVDAKTAAKWVARFKAEGVGASPTAVDAPKLTATHCARDRG